MRRKIYVVCINTRDKIFINALRCSGICTKEQALKFISGNRLRNYVLDKTIEKCSCIDKSGQRQEIYRISDAGKKWITKHIPELADRKYYSSTGVQHDLKIFDKILTLTREQQATMRCESEIRDDFKAIMDKLLQEQQFDRYEQLREALQNRTISMPDLGYGNSYFEVITSSYGDAEIKAKIDTAAVLNGTIEMVKV